MAFDIASTPQFIDFILLQHPPTSLPHPLPNFFKFNKTFFPSKCTLQSFHSRNGPAYLFTSAVNVTLGSPEERDMTTGKHLVRDLYCIACGTILGWRYELAHERREKYKEGKYILERLQLVDLEAGHINYTAPRLLGPPTSTSAAVTTAAIGLGGAGAEAGASPTGIMAMIMMPENASPLSSSGERSPHSLIDGVLSPPPPPPPPPAPTRHMYSTRGDGFGLIRRSIATAREEVERDEDMYSQPESLPDGAEGEIPDLRVLFSNWAPSPPAGGGGNGRAVSDAVVGVPAAITDPPPEFLNID
jgi:hypothetical protein